ncbi:hypothetical protein [Actinomyces provencensis]|uniref:hypothetical protein n=1 Tax=Actinomyces provencensis TaxID=1720198 RepID=UPI00096AA307|nr:hypothetical protein [Actinomyces provencensis]
MLLTVTSTALREMSRRRVALLFVFLLPLVFYLVRIDVHWQAIRFLAIGVGWAVATLSLFSHVGSRRLDRRLSVIGASPTALFFGRQLALVTVGVVVAAAYFCLVALTQDDLPRPGGIALLLVTTVLIGVPLGTLVSLVITRELEGALALLSIMALQLLVDPDGSLAKLLPLWSTRELSAYAIQEHSTDSLSAGLIHFIVTASICVLVAWIASLVRLRPVRILPPTQEEPAHADLSISASRDDEGPPHAGTADTRSRD